MPSVPASWPSFHPFRYSYLDFARYSWGANMINQFTHREGVPWVQGLTVLQYFGLAGTKEWAFVGERAESRAYSVEEGIPATLGAGSKV